MRKVNIEDRDCPFRITQAYDALKAQMDRFEELSREAKKTKDNIVQCIDWLRVCMQAERPAVESLETGMDTFGVADQVKLKALINTEHMAPMLVANGYSELVRMETDEPLLQSLIQARHDEGQQPLVPSGLQEIVSAEIAPTLVSLREEE